MKNFLSHYSPDGPRMNRLAFIKYIALFLAGCLLAIVIIMLSFRFSSNPAYYWTINPYLTSGLSVLISFMFISVCIRRNHDIGISGWWTLIYVFKHIFVITITSFMFSSTFISFSRGVSINEIIAFLYVFILCFVPGTKGPNKYGPDPLEKVKALNQIKI